MELIRADPLYERVYQNLEDFILNGEIASGERLIDTKIARNFGVSRSPVREAFRRLEKDGLLINNDGVITVFTPTLQDVVDLYQVRSGLETVAVHLATQYITEEELQQLKQYLEQTKDAIDQNSLEDIISLNTQFHEAIIFYSRNNRLKIMMDNIRSLIRLCRNTIIKHYNRGDSFLSEHADILKAMETKQPDVAAKRMEQHILKDMNYFKERYYQQKKREYLTN
jgi:DNA-binding GntR family transcriptional regulator